MPDIPAALLPPGTMIAEIARQSPEQTIEGIKRGIAKIGTQLEPDDDWAPTLFVQSETKQLIAPVGDWFVDESRKQAGAAYIAWLISSTPGAWLAGLVTTAWLVKQLVDPTDAERIAAARRPGATYADAGLPTEPSRHPDRIEIVQLTVVTKDGEESQHIAEIVRRAGRNPVLRRWETHPYDAIAGRFPSALRVGLRDAS